MAISKVNSPYTKIQDVPDVPTIGTATEGAESAEVAFTPATTGGRAYQYRALSSPGSIEAVGSSSPITVPGLTADTTYSFQVRAETNTGATNGYSSASNSIVPTSSGSYDLLETTNLSSNASSITFANLNTYTDYEHLQIRMSTRTTGGTGDGIDMFFNSDTTGSYTENRLQRTSSTVASSDTSNTNAMVVAYTAGNGGQANAYGAAIIEILDFSSTSKNTTIRSVGGDAAHGGLLVAGGLYTKTDAITSITIQGENGVFDLVTNSRFSLYGIKVG